jgi:hypothetical protein
VKRERVFQYNALDDGTPLRVLRLHFLQNQHSSIHFLDELCRALPFPIKKLHCDNGSEFPIALGLAVEAAGSTSERARALHRPKGASTWNCESGTFGGYYLD